MPASFTQEQLRQAFTRWGRPAAIRVDNGTPWGSAGDLPTDLALWIIGLGPGMIWNPPRRPQANGVVERSQGTAKRWAEPETCRDLTELQSRLEQQDHIQRARYPRIQGLSRMEAFPGLAHSGRPYAVDQESEQWQMPRVLSHLAEYQLVREVNSSGAISLYNRNKYVSRRLYRQHVYISLDPETVEWVFANAEGVCYGRKKAEELTAEQIRRLEVSHHREREG